jgi:hypothetical protein
MLGQNGFNTFLMLLGKDSGGKKIRFFFQALAHLPVTPSKIYEHVFEGGRPHFKKFDRNRNNILPIVMCHVQGNPDLLRFGRVMHDLPFFNQMFRRRAQTG